MPHAEPLQVAVPLVGTEQGVHELVPQLAVELFEAQAPLQACVPALHEKPHETPLQVAVEPAGGVHAVQLEMCQRCYMDESADPATAYSEALAAQVAPVVEQMLEEMLAWHP